MTVDPNAGPSPTPERHLDVAALTDRGTQRDLNEDACGVHLDHPRCAVLAVADGVSSSPAGEVASQMAVDIVLRAYSDAPAELDAGQRLYRAVQQANIEIYDKATAVPELRGMATTLTAAVLDHGQLTLVHVGDSRLYLLRDGALTQLTKDHTLAAAKSRYGLMSRDRARSHADRCVLTRSVGRELIVSRDRSTRRLEQGDVLVACSDGLYNVLADGEITRHVVERDAIGACRSLIDAANAAGTPDNLTVAVVRLLGEAPERPRHTLVDRLRGIIMSGRRG